MVKAATQGSASRLACARLHLGSPITHKCSKRPASCYVTSEIIANQRQIERLRTARRAVLRASRERAREAAGVRQREELGANVYPAITVTEMAVDDDSDCDGDSFECGCLDLNAPSDVFASNDSEHTALPSSDWHSDVVSTEVVAGTCTPMPFRPLDELSTPLAPPLGELSTSLCLAPPRRIFTNVPKAHSFVGRFYNSIVVGRLMFESDEEEAHESDL
jgi:hypothetical protein